jgi:hypothetical protein
MANQDAKQEPPAWLSYIENFIEEEADVYESNAPYYEVIRDLLLDSSEQDEAVEQAIKRCCDQYTGEVDDRNARIDGGIQLYPSPRHNDGPCIRDDGRAALLRSQDRYAFQVLGWAGEIRRG